MHGRPASGPGGHLVVDQAKELPVSFVRASLVALRRPQDGQGLTEYALILTLIAIVAILALVFLGGKVSQVLSDVGHSV